MHGLLKRTSRYLQVQKNLIGKSMQEQLNVLAHEAPTLQLLQVKMFSFSEDMVEKDMLGRTSTIFMPFAPNRGNGSS
jgi:hypothetical protein